MKSKTTIVRQRKIDNIQQIMDNLVFFILNYQKSNLWILKHKDVQTVSIITTNWKTSLEQMLKVAYNSSTDAKNEDSEA